MENHFNDFKEFLYKNNILIIIFIIIIILFIYFLHNRNLFNEYKGGFNSGNKLTIIITSSFIYRFIIVIIHDEIPETDTDIFIYTLSPSSSEARRSWPPGRGRWPASRDK